MNLLPMLERLQLAHVGPADELDIQLAERLNLLAGDNGLGKSFLLDVAWWALTRTWARELIIPHLPPAEPSIESAYHGKGSRTVTFKSQFDRAREKWVVKRGRPAIPGLVIYAQVDGGFSVWDPARNYWKADMPDRPQAYLFGAQEVWDGNSLCEGLLRDWASWQREQSTAFDLLKRVLLDLSPSLEEPLLPGPLRKVSLDDPKRHPTLSMPYGQHVPLIHASAGMRRIVALAYLLVWTWQEHLEACRLTGESPANEIIFLVDEIEAHLHPQWQRRVLPALLKVMDTLQSGRGAAVQVLAATHSPLVLASVEPTFDESRDAIWELKLTKGEVCLEKFGWHRRGDASAWLTSSVFELNEARSVEAEGALERARELLRQQKPERAEVLEVDSLLRAALSDTDGFWIRWSAYRDQLAS